MSDSRRVVFSVRMAPSIKTQAADAAWRERATLSEFIENAVLDRISRQVPLIREPMTVPST